MHDSVSRSDRTAHRTALGTNQSLNKFNPRVCFFERLLESLVPLVPLRRKLDHQTVQESLWHDSVETAMIYSHVLNKGDRGKMSPRDHICNEKFEVRR
jgi:hypothetical protein